jgi:hypothetical protein
MTSAAESITESLRRSRQLMVQVSSPTRLIDMMYANNFLCELKSFLYVDRKLKEVLIPCQPLVSFPVI